ncbi:MAG: hypothetical protein HYY51_03710 [Candidatus Magasanikbacteria bacterium]|nr:hypothetical protein [Candidatus Magasanikbacteria bacterium]
MKEGRTPETAKVPMGEYLVRKQEPGTIIQVPGEDVYWRIEGKGLNDNDVEIIQMEQNPETKEWEAITGTEGVMRSDIMVNVIRE